MPQLYRRRKKRPAQQLSDRYAITTEHARSLAALNRRPTLYNQRLVEHLSFIGTGGQRWVRTLQVKLPNSSEVPKRRLWIVPLGQFQLKRFADIVVTDASGSRVSLLTRHQHGLALTKATLNKHLFNLPEPYRKRLEKNQKAGKAYRALRVALNGYFTAISKSERRQILPKVLTLYVSLLDHARLDAKKIEPWKTALEADIREASRMTQYLCWAMAEPGEVVNLEVSYSATDPEYESKPKGVREAIKALRLAFMPRRSDARRKVWSDWYRQYGLSPVNYEFEIPSYLHTGSYYFTLEPPNRSYVTYLDWETGNSFDDDEVDCAFRSAHVHNEEMPRSPASDSEGRAMRAYLRCIPHHHKQIIGTAALNIALIWLLTTKDFAANISSPLAGVLMAAPSILIAYLVRQQRHYYAHVMRKQRAILWGYLSVSLVFLLTVAFSISDDFLKATVALEPSAMVLAISSAAILGWYLPLGYGFDRPVGFMTERKWNLVKQKKAGFQSIEEKWQCYQEAVAQYCRWTLRLMVVLMATTTTCMILFWDLPTRGAIPNVSGADQGAGAAIYPPSKTLPPLTHPTPTGNHSGSRGP